MGHIAGQAPRRGQMIDRLGRRQMIDRMGRHIDYLRVSLTDRCNYRCRYCMCEDMTFLPKADVLNLDEIAHLCTLFIGRGVRKLRLTGGEPLVRKGAVGLVRALSAHLDSGALDEITMTTNGALLERHATALAAAGMRRINVSLDSLRAEVFAGITRRGSLDDVLGGIAAARDAGMAVKLNMVVMAGINDGEVEAMMTYAHGHGMDLTLIETMPIGALAGETGLYIPLDTIVERLAARFTLTPATGAGAGPARYLRVTETGGRLGLVTPLSHAFCAQCNRMRLTCTGQLETCLGQEVCVDLRAPLRQGGGDEAIDDAIDRALTLKPPGHLFSLTPQARPAVERAMNLTGG